MVKKTGNLLIFLCILFASCDIKTSCKLSLQIADLQQNKVNQVEVGVPFLVQINAQNIDSDMQPDGFDAWDDFAVTFYGTSQSMTIINGQTTQTKTYTYVVTPQKKGKFNYPAVCLTDKQGKVHVSDTFKIVVGDAVQISQQAAAQPYVLQIDIPEKSVFVGQKMKVLLRFGFQEPFQNLQIHENPMQNIHRGFVSQQAQVGEFNIGDEEYESHDFVMELYPEKVGTLVIPSFQASFASQQMNVASIFSMMLSGGGSVHSQPRSVQVNPLPESSEFKNVTAIGQFDHAEFKLSSSKGSVGEGLVAKMIVSGDGNLEIVKAPLLHMPEGLHYYEGNSSLTRLEGGKCKKEFEWIVQAEYADQFFIPEQQFVYFDHKSKQYKVLTTKSQELLISGAVKREEQKSLSDDQTKKENKETEEKNIGQKQQSELSMQDQCIKWFEGLLFSGSVASKILTWFMQFLLVFLFGSMFFLISRYFVKDLFFLQTLKIRMQFLNFCKKKDMYGVYKTFEQILQKYGLEMQSQELHQCFIDLKMSDESFENWKNFVTMIWEINFAKERATDQTDLAFSLAKQWFVVILSCCKIQKKKRALASQV